MRKIRRVEHRRRGSVILVAFVRVRRGGGANDGLRIPKLGIRLIALSPARAGGVSKLGRQVRRDARAILGWARPQSGSSLTISREAQTRGPTTSMIFVRLSGKSIRQMGAYQV